MTKELEALEALKQIGAYHLEMGVAVKDLPNYEIIETALKKLERWENLKVSEEQAQWLVALVSNPGTQLKKLKALEIIKVKKVNVFIFLHSGDLETYNDMVEDDRKLTQEEFDTLKEVLL